MLETQQSIVRCLALFLRLENERQFGAILDGEQLLYSYRSHRISTENCFRPLGEIGRLERLLGTCRRLPYAAGVEKICQHGCLDGEPNVLGDIVDCGRDLDCIELADDDSSSLPVKAALV